MAEVFKISHTHLGDNSDGVAVLGNGPSSGNCPITFTIALDTQYTCLWCGNLYDPEDLIALWNSLNLWEIRFGKKTSLWGKKTSQKICPLCVANLPSYLNPIARVKDCLSIWRPYHVQTIWTVPSKQCHNKV